MNGFAELGLAQQLVDAAGALGWDAPLPIQRAAIPVLRRGANVVLRAGEGAGVTAAYGLALLDRLASTETRAGTGALVVASTDRRAVAVALELGRLAAGDVHVAALAPGWAEPAVGDVVAGTPSAVARALGSSTLKLDALETIVLDGVPALLDAANADALETVLVSVPAHAQRVITTATLTRDVDRFIEAHVRRAMTIPPRPGDEDARPAARTDGPGGSVSYVVVSGPGKEAVLARLVERETLQRVAVRSRREAEALAAAIRVRGFDAVEVGAYSDDSAAGAAVAFDVPPDAASLVALDRKHAIVLVEPSELQHLRAIAAEAGIDLSAKEIDRTEPAALDPYRDAIRRALREEDIDAQMLVLDPLFDEASPAEIAAALSAMLRRRTAPPQPPDAMPSASAPAGAPPRPQPFVRLFVGVGQKDGVRPADIVGSFTGEAGIAGEQVGRIEIRDTFSVVEVDAGIADRVIRALNGTTMRGRSVRIDYDRKSAPSPPQRRRTRPS